MAKTKIEWADRVWTPVTGCTKVSEGCRNCYAETMANRFWKDRKFSDVKFHPERLGQPLDWGKPSRIFVNSMSDLFHKDVPFEFIDEVFHIMRVADQHNYMVLTKRPEVMLKFIAWQKKNTVRYDWQSAHKNIWLGVSVEDQKTADVRIPLLLQTPAAVKFVSCEPLLGPVDLGDGYTSWLTCNGPLPGSDICCEKFEVSFDHFHGIDWVIAGGESGPGARPVHPDWVRSIRDQCVEAGVPFFFKQWGEWGLKGSVEGAKVSDFGVLDPEGTFYHGHTGWNGRPIDPDTNEAYMVRVGKKKSGRLLDGREWNEFPEVL